MNEDRGELQGIQEVADRLGITPRTEVKRAGITRLGFAGNEAMVP